MGEDEEPSAAQIKEMRERISAYLKENGKSKD
jgi:hypothetical protein